MPHRFHRGSHDLGLQRVDAVGGLGMHVHRLGARLVGGHRRCRDLVGAHRQIRVRLGGTCAVDACLEIGRRAVGHTSIFTRRGVDFFKYRARMVGHIIVCGDDALGIRIVDELNNAGARVASVQSPDGLAAAGVADAQAVICADDDDDLNLEIALLARQANPNVRVVARLANSVLRTAMAEDNGPGAILDVADLSAPSVVEACLARTTHTISVAGVDFVISGTDAPRDGTLREMYGDLAPVAVVYGEKSDTPGDVVACPGRDLRVHEGDWTAMIGTADELAAQGIAVARPVAASRVHRSAVRRVIDAVRAFREDLNPMFYRALAASTTLLLFATVLLRFAYQRPPGMSWIDALYFSTETIATVGYGDFSFIDQPTWLRLFGILLMFAGVTTTAILVAFIADVLLSRRLAYSSGRRRVRHLRHHVIVVGLGSFGIRVVSDLVAAGYDVAVIERSDDNRYLSTAAQPQRAGDLR